jgi:protein-L-isoaspartate(D-aspartate) O-methyltransferase
MVDRQIAARGVTSERVLGAMRKVPRERFVPVGEAAFAYDDTPLPIGEGQTISQPYIVAYMIEALELEGGEKVLEIGTGSGYAAAVLGEIAGEVHTVETVESLAVRARELLAELGYENIHVHHADGTLGWPAEAPYAGIVVTAAAPGVPESLQRQLEIGGRLVLPVGQTRWYQDLVRVTRLADDEYETEDLTGVRFVPLIGEQGWPSG